MTVMKHLLFGGAGAVGTSLAMCLSRRGHSVGVFVRPTTRDKILLSSPSAPILKAYDLTPRGAKQRLFILMIFAGLFFVSCLLFSRITCSFLVIPQLFFALCVARSLLPLVHLSTVPLDIVATTIPEAITFEPDVIWLTVSSNQLGTPDVTAFVTTTMSQLPNARLICIGSSPISLAVVRSLLPPSDAHRISSATVSLCAYQAPLKGESFPVTMPQRPRRPSASNTPLTTPTITPTPTATGAPLTATGILSSPSMSFSISASASASFAPAPLAPIAVVFIPGGNVVLSPVLAEQVRDPVLCLLAAELAATAAGGVIEAPSTETALGKAFTSMLVTFTTLTVAREGWSITAAAAPEAAQRCAAAVEQAVPLVVLKTVPKATEAMASEAAKWAWLIVRVWLWASAFAFPLLLPMDVSAFYSAHYRKVWPQFCETARALAAEGRAKGYPVGAIERLAFGTAGSQTAQRGLEENEVEKPIGEMGLICPTLTPQVTSRLSGPALPSRASTPTPARQLPQGQRAPMSPYYKPHLYQGPQPLMQGEAFVLVAQEGKKME